MLFLGNGNGNGNDVVAATDTRGVNELNLQQHPEATTVWIEGWIDFLYFSVGKLQDTRLGLATTSIIIKLQLQTAHKGVTGDAMQCNAIV